MAISQETVKNIARLARIGISDKDVSTYADDMSRVLGLAEQLANIDTTDIEPLSHPLETTAQLRKDVVVQDNESGTLQQLSGAVEDGLYLVPKVIE